MSEILWMDEDELRHACFVLVACLARSQEQMQYLVGNIEGAVADGYRIGYADAVADRALQVTFAAQERDATCVGLH